MENSIDAAGTLFVYFLKMRQKAGILSNGLISGNYFCMPYYSDERHVMHMLENLAKITPGENSKAENYSLPELFLTFKSGYAPGTRLVIISPVFSEDIIKTISIAKKLGFIAEFFETTINLRREIKSGYI